MGEEGGFPWGDLGLGLAGSIATAAGTLDPRLINPLYTNPLTGPVMWKRDLFPEPTKSSRTSSNYDPALQGRIGMNRGIYSVPGVGRFDTVTGKYVGPNASTPAVTAGRGSAPSISPNTIVQRGSASDGISDEYRAQLGNWQALQKSAAGALKGFQPGSGPMPDAATKAAQAGQDLWAKLHPDLAKPGGAVGTYNPLMQARGDVPSMADLWSGMRSIQAPTAGPGRTSEDVTDEAMAKARAEGRYFEPSGTMGGFAPAADPATQQRMQQFGTAMQAQKGTEETSAAQRSQDFVNKFKLGSLNPGSYNFPSYDANAMMNAPSALFK
jgi:hypothetical protein